MREIKFRAWDKENRKMYYEGFVVAADGGFHFLDYLCGDKALRGSNEAEDLLKRRHDIDAPAVIDFADWSFERMILMQYTGLKDKSGKEIYEGDIFKDYSKEVFWWAGAFYVGNYVELASDVNDPEVIGNIYENPELLEKK